MRGSNWWRFIPLVAATSMSSAMACDITLSPGATQATIQAALNSAFYTEICLNAGQYWVWHLDVPAAKALRGLGTDQTGTIITGTNQTSSSGRLIYVFSGATIRNLTVDAGAGLQSAGTPYVHGVFVNSASSATVWDVTVKYAQINLTVYQSSSVNLWNVNVSHNGAGTANGPDPNIWITGSAHVTMLYGSVVGDSSSSGFNDGEVSVQDNSSYVDINGTTISNSGAAGTYIVNCSHCTVENTTIAAAAGFGIDVGAIRGGVPNTNTSPNFTASNNNIYTSGVGGAVFDSSNSASGVWSSNHFYNNAAVKGCPGIALQNTAAGVTLTSNTANNGATSCVI